MTIPFWFDDGPVEVRKTMEGTRPFPEFRVSIHGAHSNLPDVYGP